MSGEENKIQNLIEQIAMDIMSVDLDDLSHLGAIHTKLEEIARGFVGPRPVSADLCKNLAQVIENIILDECGDEKDPLDLVAQGIGILQRIDVVFTREGRETLDAPDFALRMARFSDSTEVAEPQDPAEQEEESPLPPEEEAPAKARVESPPSAPPGVDAGILADFIQEAEEHLGAAESALLSLEKTPEDGEILNAVFRSFHTIKGAAGFLNLQDITRAAHAVEDVLDSARKGRLKLNASILDVAFESVDLLKNLLTDAKRMAEGGPPRENTELVLRGFLSRIVDVVRGSRQTESPAGGRAAEAKAEPGEPATSLKDPSAAEGKRQDQHDVRVKTEKLDQLVNMVGELVIAQTQVSQHPEIAGAQSQKLLRDISQLNRITRDLQEVAMSMRMVPIRATFERMARLARDLSRKFGKPVDFRMSGEETELDKNMVEEIVDPLTHMMRNALDHGLEPAGDRQAAGKPEKGVVSLEAFHRGGNIVIELKDDGRGIDRERVFKKAVERGLARADEELTDEQIFGFLFQAGFSTAEKVSDVSGRGVGMDVVRRNIEKLRGRVEIRSEKGKGSTFAIQLPLTLAIIDGMVVGVGKERYILPLTSIVKSLRPSREEVSTVMGRDEMVKVQGNLFPLVRLHSRYGVRSDHTDPWESLTVLVEAEGGKCCLMVDELLGIQQVVIKGLEDDLRTDRSLSGCTILGDGRVGLILDVNDLVRKPNGKAA